jgi:hypothetical protein
MGVTDGDSTVDFISTTEAQHEEFIQRLMALMDEYNVEINEGRTVKIGFMECWEWLVNGFKRLFKK